MDAAVTDALERGGVIDITTLGAKTGKPHRVEINFHHFDGNYYITGQHGRKRDWLANMKANPKFTVHLKHGLIAEVPAEAKEIVDKDRRAEVLYRILTESWGNVPAKGRSTGPYRKASTPNPSGFSITFAARTWNADISLFARRRHSTGCGESRRTSTRSMDGLRHGRPLLFLPMKSLQ